MAEGAGLRERKKQRTRRALIEAAAQLFEERGYDQTTVAHIAAAVEVSPRTFFSYFPSKEDVLFADTGERIQIAVDAIATRSPEETVASALMRAIGLVVGSEVFAADLGGRPGRVRMALLARSPALQAAAMRRLLQGQAELAGALHRAYPERLDAGAAAAMVGALIGAMVAAALTSLRQGEDLDQTRAQVRRAAEIAVRGIGATAPG